MLISDHLETTEVDFEPEDDAWFPANAAVDREEMARTREPSSRWWPIVDGQPDAQ